MGFEATISAGEWPKTYALDRAATGIGIMYFDTGTTYNTGTNTLRSGLSNWEHYQYSVYKNRSVRKAICGVGR